MSEDEAHVRFGIGHHNGKWYPITQVCDYPPQSWTDGFATEEEARHALDVLDKLITERLSAVGLVQFEETPLNEEFMSRREDDGTITILTTPTSFKGDPNAST